MIAGTLHIVIQQGATFSLSVTWEINGVVVNLTGYTARMTARTHYGGPSIFSLTSAAGDITITPPTGTLVIAMTAAATAALAARGPAEDAAAGVYDLELVSGATVWRLLQGTVIISPEATT